LRSPQRLLSTIPGLTWMACYTRLYGVDLAELRSFFGSADQARLERLVESRMEDIEENDNRFEDEIENADWPMTIDAIAEILTGKCIDGALAEAAIDPGSRSKAISGGTRHPA
jgi:hypothetical protein